MENETMKKTMLKDFRKVNKNGQYMLCERYGISNGIKIRAMIYIQTHKRHTKEWHICMNNYIEHSKEYQQAYDKYVKDVKTRLEKCLD